jgi:hypothetical protein
MLMLTSHTTGTQEIRQSSSQLACRRQMRYLEDDTAAASIQTSFQLTCRQSPSSGRNNPEFFRHIILSETSGRQSLIEEYSQFVQSNYSGMTNIHASLENLSGKFRSSPRLRNFNS